MLRNRLTSFRTMTMALAILLTVTSVSFAQFGRGGGRGFMSGTRLLVIEMVQKELELDEDQIKEIAEVASGKRAAPKKDEEAAPAERPNFREMSDEQRKAYFEKRTKEREEKRNGQESAIEEILLPHQVRRFEQIKIQLMGSQALSDPKIAEEIGIDEATKEKMAEIAKERREEMMDVMRDAFQGGDREEIQETMKEMRESIESAVTDAMSSDQLAKYKELKGPPLKFTAMDLMGEMFRGRGGRGGGGRGGRGGRGGDN